MSAEHFQQVVLALGGEPLDPVMPRDERVSEALRRMEIVMASDEYALLAAKRGVGSITAEEFAKGVDALLKEVE